MAYQKLEPEFKAKWLEALRSGKYKQGACRLYAFTKHEPRFCCLGVAGMVSGHTKSELRNRMTFKIRENFEHIPSQLIGDASNNILVGKLATMNDDLGYDFKEIANWIEENL